MALRLADTIESVFEIHKKKELNTLNIEVLICNACVLEWLFSGF